MKLWFIHFWGAGTSFLHNILVSAKEQRWRTEADSPLLLHVAHYIFRKLIMSMQFYNMSLVSDSLATVVNNILWINL